MRAPSDPAPEAAAQLSTKVGELTWYHTLELPEGVVTPGFFDHRPDLHRYRFPDDLSGQRALDVGQQDGYWSFELERRGASVTGIDLDRAEDLDWPPRLSESGTRREEGGFPLADGTAFRLAREALGSSVERLPISAYEVTPETVGTFDLVLVGSVLVHMRDPMLALERLASVCTGRLILCEPYARRLRLVPFGRAVEFTGESPYMTWWIPSVRAWSSMVRCAGFDDVTPRGRFNMHFSDMPGGVHHVVLHARGTA